MDQNIYNAVGEEIDAILYMPTSEKERLIYREKVLAIFKKYGITEDEWETELERRLDILFAKWKEEGKCMAGFGIANTLEYWFVDDLPDGHVLVECQMCAHRFRTKEESAEYTEICPKCGKLLSYPEGASW